VVKTTTRAEAGVTEWILSNGATVVLKPTTLKEDQILFRAFAPGGTSLASDADFVSARIADDVVPAGGVGRLSSVMLDKVLTGKAVAVSPFINEVDQGMGGGSTPQDLEAMFQLIYLRFTQPRADPTVFSTMAARAKALLANRAASPDVVFNQAVTTALTQNNPRRRPETPATVDQWNLDKALGFYKARFADASGFTFVFVGSFTPDTIKPLVERYLGSLPATHASEKPRDLGITPPRGVVDKTIEKGIAPKSQVAIVLSGPIEYDQAHLMAFRTVTLLLQSRLLDTIRQELGGTYAITVNPDVDKFPHPMYTVRIDWTCDPARAAALTQRVLDEIGVVRAVRLSEDQMVMIREGLLREFETNSQENSYFLQAIAQRYQDGDSADLASVVHVPEQLATLTAQQVMQAARTYLNTDNYVKVTQMPEAK
jgi:zinc protease